MSKKPLRSQARAIVYNVYRQCFEEKSESDTQTSTIKRVEKLTGVSFATIKRIIMEASSNNGVFVTPGKGRKGGKKRIDIDDFDLDVIRRKINEFYVVRKEVPTLQKLLHVFREDIGFTGQKESLRCILKKISFEYVKCQSQRKLLMERHDIVMARYNYLTKIKQNADSDKKKYVVYLDETYIHPSCGVAKCWRSKDLPGPSKPISPGARWIIVHAGGERGFVPNCCLIYRSKSLSADYHHDMNSSNFKKWITEKLIPNLHEPCIIVMDNASYHSVQLNRPPTQFNCIGDIKTWLRNNNFYYEDNWRKCKLLKIVQQNKGSSQYEIDELLKAHRHEVLRLPPYHCQLNPIEMIWGIMKQKVADKNVNKPASAIKELTEEAFSQISVDDWLKCCRPVHDIENKYYEQDGIVEMMQDRFIVNVEDSSGSSSDCSTDAFCRDSIEYLEVEWLESMSSDNEIQ